MRESKRRPKSNGGRPEKVTPKAKAAVKTKAKPKETPKPKPAVNAKSKPATAKAGKADDAAREDRIIMEIVVDAYDSDERAMGWYAYLEEKLTFPFTARCVEKRSVSPLRVGDEVQVVDMPPNPECRHEMFLTIGWGDDDLAVPLSQLEPGSDADADTRQAVGDWHYWVREGYEF